MKKGSLGCMFVFALLACGGHVAAVPPVGDSSDRAFGAGEAGVANGIVRIRIRPDVQPPVTGAFERGEAATGNPCLDRVLNSLGATEVRPVFSEGGRFAQRRRRYGLHLWYDIEIDEHIPVSEAVEALSGLETIEYAGPVYLAEPSEDNTEGTKYHEGEMER